MWVVTVNLKLKESFEFETLEDVATLIASCPNGTNFTVIKN